MTADHEKRVAEIRENLDSVRERVARAADQSGRTGDEVTVIAVSKTWPVDVVQAAVDAGVTELGETRVQEGQAKIPAVTGSPTWHLVGHLQRNKARVAVEL